MEMSARVRKNSQNIGADFGLNLVGTGKGKGVGGEGGVGVGEKRWGWGYCLDGNDKDRIEVVGNKG